MLLRLFRQRERERADEYVHSVLRLQWLASVCLSLSLDTFLPISCLFSILKFFSGTFDSINPFVCKGLKEKN